MPRPTTFASREQRTVGVSPGFNGLPGVGIGRPTHLKGWETRLKNAGPPGNSREWGRPRPRPLGQRYSASEAQGEDSGDVDLASRAGPRRPATNNERRRSVGVLAHGVPERLRRDESLRIREICVGSIGGGNLPRPLGQQNGNRAKGKGGLLPCCFHATHVALPPAYALDEFRNLKVRGLSAGNFRAPTWDKRLAHSKTWDRAAATHAKPTNTLQPRVPAAKPTPRLPTVATNRCLLQRRPCELLRERVAGCQGSGNCVTEESCSSRPRSYASKRSPSAPGDDFGTPPH